LFLVHLAQVWSQAKPCGSELVVRAEPPGNLQGAVTGRLKGRGVPGEGPW
jgi:hypothetical protein